jgi:acetyl esterase/lipase
MKRQYLTIVILWVLTLTLFGQALPEISVKPDQIYGHKFGMAMTFDVYIPANNNGAAVLYINSGGYASGVIRQCVKGADGNWKFIPIDKWPKNLPGLLAEQYSFEKFLAAGFTVFDIRHGSTPKFTIDEIFEDLTRAVRFIKFHANEYSIDTEKLGLFGGSAGGHLALLLASHTVMGITNYKDVTGAFELNRFPEPELETSSNVKAVGVYYPAGYDFVSNTKTFPEVMKSLPSLNVDNKILDSLSIKNYISANNPPTFIIYGDKDFPFIIESAKNVAADLQKNKVEVKTVVIPNVGHEFKGADGSYKDPKPGQFAMNELVEWFKKQLKK